MKKLLQMCLAILAFTPLGCPAQNVAGPVYSYPSNVVGLVPFYTTPQSGIPILTPSKIGDNGTGITYNGIPLSGTGTVTTSGTITPGHCASFLGGTVIQDSGASCTGGNSYITSLTTTGSSGVATVTAGVLNIPNYSFTQSFPSVGIMTSTGTGFGTSLTPPGSAIVGISDTQTLTNKTIGTSQLSGTIQCTNEPASTGDVSQTAGTCATTVLALKNIALPTLSGSTGYLFDNNGVLSLQTPTAGYITNLTTTGTSGNASVTSGVLNIPNYTSNFQSLTTTGTSGVATLSAGVLNIPNYASSNYITSLTTTGTGNASVTSGVLNIPNTTFTGGTVTSPITAPSFGTNGAYNGQLDLTYTGSAGAGPSANQFQISPLVPITTPWGISPAGAPPVSTSALILSTSGQMSFSPLSGTDSNLVTGNILTPMQCSFVDANAGLSTATGNYCITPSMSFQAALNAADANGGGSIWLSPGTYTAAITGGSSPTSTLCSSTGGVYTITAANSLVANENVLLQGFTNCSAISGKILPVSATGLSGTQYSVTYGSATVASAADTGSAIPVGFVYPDDGNAISIHGMDVLNTVLTQTSPTLAITSSYATTSVQTYNFTGSPAPVVGQAYYIIGTTTSNASAINKTAWTVTAVGSGYFSVALTGTAYGSSGSPTADTGTASLNTSSTLGKGNATQTADSKIEGLTISGNFVAKDVLYINSGVSWKIAPVLITNPASGGHCARFGQGPSSTPLVVQFNTVIDCEASGSGYNFGNTTSRPSYNRLWDTYASDNYSIGTYSRNVNSGDRLLGSNNHIFLNHVWGNGPSSMAYITTSADIFGGEMDAFSATGVGYTLGTGASSVSIQDVLTIQDTSGAIFATSTSSSNNNVNISNNQLGGLTGVATAITGTFGTNLVTCNNTPTLGTNTCTGAVSSLTVIPAGDGTASLTSGVLNISPDDSFTSSASYSTIPTITTAYTTPATTLVVSSTTGFIPASTSRPRYLAMGGPAGGGANFCSYTGISGNTFTGLVCGKFDSPLLSIGTGSNVQQISYWSSAGNVDTANASLIQIYNGGTLIATDANCANAFQNYPVGSGLYPCNSSNISVAGVTFPNGGVLISGDNSGNGDVVNGYLSLTNALGGTIGTAIASSATIAPTHMIQHVTGTAAIGTMTSPFNAGSGCLVLIADGAWTWTAGTTAGKFKVAGTATAGSKYQFCYDGTLWY